MDYRQNNPIPLPAAGTHQLVASPVETSFDWQYALEEQGLLALYEKGKAQSWNATELDWSIDVDLARMQREAQENPLPQNLGGMMEAPVTLDDAQGLELSMNINAYLLSQFLHGEQGALLATAKIVQTAPDTEHKFYAANQVADEARHVEVYHRYLTEKFGISYEVNPSLQTLLEDIIGDSRWDLTFLGMQIMVEGLALAAFSMMRVLLAREPLIQDITARIMADESRHVAFGVLALEDLYTHQLSSSELAEREEFVIEATHLLRERLSLSAVFHRLEYDVALWDDWVETTTFMRGFRQMMFSKIVPNLKRLGLLTPRVREAYAAMDLLRYEHNKDSIEESTPQPPTELVELMLAKQAQGRGPANS